MKKRNDDRLIALLLTIVMVMSLFAGPVFAANGSGNPSFKDVPESAWYYDYVMCLAKRGVVKGYGDTGEFRPENKVIREHAAKMVTLAAGLSYQGKKANFPDVDKDGEMSPYIAALVAKGAVQGFPDGTFKPLDNIKRGHAAKIVALAFGIKPSTLEVKLLDLPTHDPNVSDSIETLTSNGIVKGYGDTNNFKPYEEINRAEFAKMLCIAAATAAIQEAEETKTPAAIAAAQTLLNDLPKDQDKDTQTFLQGRLDAVEEPVTPDPGPDDPGPVVPPVKKYTVTFDVEGIADQIVVSGKRAIKPEDPIDPTGDQYFDGWYTDNNVWENVFSFETPITADTQLYAKWASKKNVFFLLDDASPGGIRIILKEFSGEHQHEPIGNLSIADFKLTNKGVDGASDSLIEITQLTGTDGSYTIKGNDNFVDGLYKLIFDKEHYVSGWPCNVDKDGYFEVNTEKSVAKAAIKPSWEVKSVEEAGTLPVGVSSADYKITIKTSYDMLMPSLPVSLPTYLPVRG